MKSLWIEVFIPAKKRNKKNYINKRKRLTHEGNVTDGRCSVVFMQQQQQQRTWGKKSLQHYTMQCHLTVLWYSIFSCKSPVTFNQVLGFFTGPLVWDTDRHRHHRDRSELSFLFCFLFSFFSAGTDVHLDVSKLCCGVEWLCSHAMVSTRIKKRKKKNIF